MMEYRIPKDKFSASTQSLLAYLDERAPLKRTQKPVLRKAMPPLSPEQRQETARIARQHYLERLARNETITLKRAPVPALTPELRQQLTEVARAYHEKLKGSAVQLPLSHENLRDWVDEAVEEYERCKAEAKAPASVLGGLKHEVMYSAKRVKDHAWEMLAKVTADVKDITEKIREELAVEFFIIPAVPVAASATRSMAAPTTRTRSSMRSGEEIVGVPGAEMVVDPEVVDPEILQQQAEQAEVKARFDRAEKQGLGWELLSINREEKELQIHLLKLGEPIVYSDRAAENAPRPKVVPESSGLDLSVPDVTVNPTQLSTVFDVILTADHDFPDLSDFCIGLRTDEEDTDKVVIVLAPQENQQIQ